MNSVNAAEYARNYGFWNEDEQRAIMAARVAIAGVGGDGFQMGLKLARMGVQTFDIADPEVFEPENANRVPGATTETYGLKKAEVFASEVHKINPGVDVRIFTDGVTEENVDEFTNRATLIYDESELTYLQIGTALAREARRKGIPNVMVMNIGFAAQVTSFHPESKHTFERMMGIPKGMPLDEVKDMKVNFERCLPYIPQYGDLRTLAAVQEGASLPSISQGVDVASAIGTAQGFLHIIHSAGIENNRPQPIWAPKIAVMDAYSMLAKTTRFPRTSYYRHAARTMISNVLKINSIASYTDTDRQRRMSQ